jgi:hypothetical protein
MMEYIISRSAGPKIGGDEWRREREKNPKQATVDRACFGTSGQWGRREAGRRG